MLFMVLFRLVYLLHLSTVAKAFFLPSWKDVRRRHQRRRQQFPPPPSSHQFQLFASSSPTSKTADEEKFIKQALLQNSLFAGIPEETFKELISALEKKTAQLGDTIISQGDSCKDGYVYLVAEGSCRVLVDNKTVPEPYGIIGQNTVFGEMGILYDETRAATIMVASDTLTYYQIAGDIFKAALLSAESSSSTATISFDKMQEIDEVINTISGTQTLYGGNVIPSYRPERAWLWQQYGGTVLKISLETTLLAMAASAVFVVAAKVSTNDPLTWEPFGFHKPAPNAPLAAVHNLWEIQRTLSTFVLTFFVNQSFDFWKKVYTSVREVQGTLSSFNLMVATNVIRNQDGKLSREGEQLIEDMGQCSRLFHILFWASRTNRFSVLMSDDGLRRMESRGLMSTKQLEILLELDLPNDQLFSAPLDWMVIRCNQAMDKGILYNDNATKSAILKDVTTLRNAFASINNLIAGRMPLPYVQFVQVLVDLLLCVAPLALYVDMGEYSVIAVGLVALFFGGLLNLSKVFLDPLNNEEFCENSIFLDLGVIIREANGDSTRWRKAGATSPFSDSEEEA